MNELLIGWLLIGLGVVFGLMTSEYLSMPRKYKWYNMLLGVILTITLWPMALYNNRELEK